MISPVDHLSHTHKAEKLLSWCDDDEGGFHNAAVTGNTPLVINAKAFLSEEQRKRNGTCVLFTIIQNYCAQISPKLALPKVKSNCSRFCKS